MSPMPSFAAHQITIVEPGTRTVHGSTVADWSEAKVTTRTISNCLVQPQTSADSGDEPDTTRDEWKVLIPGAATPPKSTARIRHPFRAGDYSIKGEILPQPGIRDGVDHWFMVLERQQTSG